MFASVAIADTAATIDPIFNFIRDNLVGHSVKIAATVTLPGTDVVADWKNVNSFSNLARTATGLTFDRIFVVTQTNHTPNPDGTTTDTVVDRVVASHCELKASEATDAPAGIMFGFCHSVANSSFAAVGSASLVDFRIENGTLVERIPAGTPGDCFANPATTYRLCTSKSASTYSVVNGKVKLHVESENYFVSDYDHGTLQSRGPASIYDYSED